MGSGKTIIMSVKIMLMSTGVLSIAILLSMSMPNLLTSTTSNLPSLFSSLRSWLRPPYLYFIINAIIIAIVAISRLHHNHQGQLYSNKSAQHVHDVISVRGDHHQFLPYGVVSVADVVVDNNNNNNNVGGGGYYNDVVSVKEVDEREKRVVDEEVVIKKVDESAVVERSAWAPPPSSTPPLMRQSALERVSPEFLMERPPATSRFAHHGRPVKAKPTLPEGGKALKVSKPKKQDTLESTWKAITEGRHIPLTRHMKKSDTWEGHNRQIDLLDDSFPFPVTVKKSETFKERTNNMSPSAMTTKLKKEPSLGQDELNRRVEAFINKFNEDMRLQRQQSMQQFMEMINRAA